MITFMPTKTLLLRLLLIVAVLGLCGWMMYPPQKKLKLGLDLAGGTQLIYQVDVPADQDAPQVLEQVIATLRKRIDPNGVMNLIWRPVAGNRIEIQVPEAPPEVRQRLNSYTTVRDRLLAGNLARRRVLEALRMAPEDRVQRFEVIAGGDPQRRAALDVLAEAHDVMQAARQPVDELSAQLDNLERQIAALPPDAPVDQKSTLESRRLEMVGRIEHPVRSYNQARDLYERALGQVLAENVSEAELDQALSLPDTVTRRRGAAAETKTERELALERLIAAHPARVPEIREVAAAYSVYEQVKGPLDDPNDLITLLKGSGVLEFRIAPATVPDEQDYREQLSKRGPRAGHDRPFRWMVIDDIATFTDRRGAKEALEADPEAFFRSRGLIGQEYAGNYYVLLANDSAGSLTHAQSDWRLERAWAGMDQSGMPAVMFRLNTIGGHLMGQLTGAHVGEPMAIVLDGRVISTPTLQSRIHDSGQITGGGGGFSQAELSYLIRTLNAGSLQGSLSEEPISIKRTGPQLGADNLERGLRTAVYALILVSLFMAGYYFFWGLAANFALYANMVIVLGIMSLIQASFTLSGIAGLVLTIGMAVDANVLIFERAREELERGEDIRTAVRLGFEKAFSTIVDSNLTTLITCVVLYYTATADIKGFGLTLGIGIVASMWTALFCTRTFVELWLNLTNARSLPQLPTLLPSLRRALEPNIDWMKMRKISLTVSLALSLCGLTLAIYRGADMLDIEFRSGTAVGFELTADAPAMTLPQVRERLNKVSAARGMPEIAGDRATVVTVGDVVRGEARGFSIAVLNEDSHQVSDAIKEAFGDVLDVERPVQFDGVTVQDVGVAPVYRVTVAELGGNIDRPGIAEDVGDYLGGVAIVLGQLDPPLSEAEVEKRLERLRVQPPYSEMGFRQSQVIGLDVAPGALSRSGAPLYRSVAVVSRDTTTNYVDNPEGFASDPMGLAATEWQLAREAMLRDSSLDSVSNFSSQVSSTMKAQAAEALILSLLAVGAYIWLRFGSLRWSLGAIAALVHDVSLALGLCAISYYLYETVFGQALLLTDFKINIALVAAMLTIVGYSLNDTIVVFDRIRENRGRLPELTPEIINRSINQTISRTLLTGTTTLLAVLVMYVIGGDGVHGFAFAMLIGVLVGTYSSIAVASPILLLGKHKAIEAVTARPAIGKA